MHPTIIIRHRKENLKKCSLRGLEKREDHLFFTYPKDQLPDLSNYILLKMDAPPLSSEDQNKDILLIDSTWKYLEKILKIIPKNIESRSIPSNFVSAYPRAQTLCPNPKLGLASIEALYIAYMIGQRNIPELLNNYYWRDDFLKINNLDSFKE